MSYTVAELRASSSSAMTETLRIQKQMASIRLVLVVRSNDMGDSIESTTFLECGDSYDKSKTARDIHFDHGRHL